MAQTKIDPTQITLGTANGIATLDSGGHLPSAQLPPSIVGAIVFKGTWDASTNTPTLTSGVGTAGWEYIVSVAGTTTLDGTSTWNVNDTVIFDGTKWNRIIGAQVQHVYGTTNQVTVSPNTGDVTISLPTTVQLTNVQFGDGSIQSTGVAHFNNMVSVGTATHTIAATEDYIGVSYNSGPVALALTTVNNKKVVIKDEGGFAANNIITITPSSGLVEGQANITISVNWMSLTLVCRAGNWFVC